MDENCQVNIRQFDPRTMPLSCTWVVIGAPGTGKCLGIGTPVIMEDGSVKEVQHIKCGDILLGDNGSDRIVLSTTIGHGMLYKIYQDSADDFICNGEHILVLFDKNDNTYVELTVNELAGIDLKRYRGIRKTKNCPENEYCDVFSELDIRILDPGEYYGFQITGNGRFFLGDGTITHNTTFIENICYSVQDRYPVARCFMGTPTGYKKFKDIFGELYVSPSYNEEDEKKYVLRQKKCSMEDFENPSSINIVDDCGDDPKVFKSKMFRGIFKLGSQHWNQLFMLGNQYAIDFPPDVRKSVSYVALFREVEETELKKLYDNFGGICGSYQNFKMLMRELTGDYTCMIINKRSQSNEVEDNVFYFRTKVLPDWKFGSKEFRNWNKDRYNTKYVEEVEF